MKMVKPEMELIEFEQEDVIVTSCSPNCAKVGAENCPAETWGA